MATEENACILVAEVTGGGRLFERLGNEEGQHAVDRCLNRIERVVSSNRGEIIQRSLNWVVALFPKDTSAVLAAQEMIDRILALPPISGIELSCRVGVHHGDVERGDPPRGEGLMVAHRIAAIAQPSQSLASQPVVDSLSDAVRVLAEPVLEAGEPVGGLDVTLYQVSHHAGIPKPAPVTRSSRQVLRVRHGRSELLMSDHRPLLLLGREAGNEIAIDDPRASRQHARIERRADGYHLVDVSTNGTYVRQGEAAERFLRGEEVLLTESGRIGCGFSTAEIVTGIVTYSFD